MNEHSPIKKEITKWKETDDSNPTENQLLKRTAIGKGTNHSDFPVKRDPKIPFMLSIIGAVLMATISLCSLLYSSIIYPTDELLQSFVANDVANLVVGLPILLGSMWLTKRGKLVGLLLWPGALLFVLYNYIAYVFGTPFSPLTFAYVMLVLLSAYSALVLLNGIDKKSVKKILSTDVPLKTACLVLVLFGVFFTFRAIGIVAEAGMNQLILPLSEIGVLIADVVISALFIAGGVLLLRRNSIGYVSGLGLLFAASMLFISLILVLLLQPVLTNAAFAPIDVIVVFVMGLICFIPFAFFTRRVLSKEKSTMYIQSGGKNARY
jgi:hypothetical protein